LGVLDEGTTVGSIARDLDLTETALREWVNRARADRSAGRTGVPDRRATNGG
jgi:transposase